MSASTSAPEVTCSYCGGHEINDFQRGLIQSGIRKFFRMPYCALICSNCGGIAGWEKPAMPPEIKSDKPWPRDR